MLVALSALCLLAVQVTDYGNLTKLLAGRYQPSTQAHLQQAALLDWSVQSPRSVPSGQVGCPLKTFCRDSPVSAVVDSAVLFCLLEGKGLHQKNDDHHIFKPSMWAAAMQEA